MTIDWPYYFLVPILMMSESSDCESTGVHMSSAYMLRSWTVMLTTITLG